MDRAVDNGGLGGLRRGDVHPAGRPAHERVPRERPGVRAAARRIDADRGDRDPARPRPWGFGRRDRRRLLHRAPAAPRVHGNRPRDVGHLSRRAGLQCRRGEVGRPRRQGPVRRVAAGDHARRRSDRLRPGHRLHPHPRGRLRAALRHGAMRGGQRDRPPARTAERRPPGDPRGCRGMGRPGRGLGIAREAIALPARIAVVAAIASRFDALGGADAAVATIRRPVGRVHRPRGGGRVRRPRRRSSASSMEPTRATPCSRWSRRLSARCRHQRCRTSRRRSPMWSTSSPRTRSATPEGWRTWRPAQASASGSRRGSVRPARGRAAARRRTGRRLRCDLGTARSADHDRLGAGPTPRVPLGAHPRPVRCPPTDRGHRRSSPRTPRRFRVSPGCIRPRPRARSEDPRRRRRVPGDDPGPPHRAALPPERAARLLEHDVRSGRLDGDAVRAVIDAAGLEVAGRVRVERASGLSDREVEVLRLLARGLSNREIARQLDVSPRTAEHHVQHIYAKIGLSSRAAAALFAMEHDLLP